MKFDVTISLVLYKSNEALVSEAINSVYRSSLNFKLYLIDNSPSDDLKSLKRDHRTEYIFNNKNLGFGKAHNLAISKAVDESLYHLVLNPDVYFYENVLEHLFTFMQNNKDVGLISPKILYPDGETQRLCKLLPSPVDLFGRRFMGNMKWVEERNRKYELHDSGYDKNMNVPYLSGCFMFLRTSVLREVGFFDERIFMYIEDADLTRRIHYKYKTLYYPEVQIYHHYAKGSYKNRKLMLYNIHGATVYFCKWGWFVDRDRREINKKVINNYLKT